MVESPFEDVALNVMPSGADLTVNGKPAAGQPYWHWAFPYVRVRWDGDRVFENGALANDFTGTGVGNDSLVPAGLNPANQGPPLSPAVMPHAVRTLPPAATTRPAQ